jgi:hypothetical protein
MSPNDDDDVRIEYLVTFEFGDLPGDGIALLLAYATSQEKRSKGEMESFVIGMTREKAQELGRALLEKSGKAPPTERPIQTQH